MTRNSGLKGGETTGIAEDRQKVIGWTIHANPRFKEELRKALPYVFLARTKLDFLKRWAENEYRHIDIRDRAMLTRAEHDLNREVISITGHDPAFLDILVSGFWARRREHDPFALAGREFELVYKCCIRFFGLVRKFPRLMEIRKEEIRSLGSLCIRMVEVTGDEDARGLSGYSREAQAWRNILVDIQLLDRPLADADEKCGDLGRFRKELADSPECYFLSMEGKSLSEIGFIRYGDAGDAGKQKAERKVRYFRRVAGLGPLRVQGRKDRFAQQIADSERSRDADSWQSVIGGIEARGFLDRLFHDRLIEEDSDRMDLIAGVISQCGLARGKPVTSELIKEILRELLDLPSEIGDRDS